MVKKQQGEVEKWQAAIGELEAKQQELVAKRDGLMAGLTRLQEEDPGTSKILDLNREIRDVQTDIHVIGGQLKSCRETLKQARREANEAKVKELRPAERKAWDAVAEKVQELQAVIEASDEVAAQITRSGGTPHAAVARPYKQTIRHFAKIAKTHDPFSQWVD